MIQYIDHDTSVREEKRVHDELSFPRLVLVPLSRAVDCLLPGNPRCTEYASSSSSSSSTSTPSTYNPLLLSHRSHPPPLAADKLPTGTLWHPPRAPPPIRSVPPAARTRNNRLPYIRWRMRITNCGPDARALLLPLLLPLLLSRTFTNLSSPPPPTPPPHPPPPRLPLLLSCPS